MRSALLYRIAAVLLVLFAAGHTLGFLQIAEDPTARPVAQAMQSAAVTLQGSQRTFWDFYVGFGLFVTAFLLFAAVLAWELGSMARAGTPAPVAAAWGLVVCFAVITVLNWRYFFVTPEVFSTAITLCLAAAAWSGRRSSAGAASPRRNG